MSKPRRFFCLPTLLKTVARVKQYEKAKTVFFFLSGSSLPLSTLCLLVFSFFGAFGNAQGVEQRKDNIPSIEEMVANVRPSVVTIRHVGRGGNDAGLGTGFVISSDGFIATNLHVIGEARPVSVELADGRAFDVTEVHATDRNADVAVIRIEAKGLQPLALATASLRDGQEIIALELMDLSEALLWVTSGRRVIDGT